MSKHSPMTNLDWKEPLVVIRFGGAKAGPRLLVLGAVHGDEVCGTDAIRAIVSQLENNQLELVCGEVTFVPICNPKAYAARLRHVGKNLNRMVAHYSNPQTYEEELANQLTGLIAASDYLLDIHSFESEGEAFVFQDYTDDKAASFARCLGLNIIITGWPEMYADPAAYAINAGDTIGYAHQCGITGALIECGQHNDTHAAKIAEQAIINALMHLQMIGGRDFLEKFPNPKIIQARKVYPKHKEGVLAKNWQHLDAIAKGEILATYVDGAEETAPCDGIILLPNAKAAIGDEWFYLGTKES